MAPVRSNPGSHADSSFSLTLSPSPIGTAVGFTFKIYSGSSFFFWPLPPLPSWSKALSLLVGVMNSPLTRLHSSQGESVRTPIRLCSFSSFWVKAEWSHSDPKNPTKFGLWPHLPPLSLPCLLLALLQPTGLHGISWMCESSSASEPLHWPILCLKCLSPRHLHNLLPHGLQTWLKSRLLGKAHLDHPI